MVEARGGGWRRWGMSTGGGQVGGGGGEGGPGEGGNCATDQEAGMGCKC